MADFKPTTDMRVFKIQFYRLASPATIQALIDWNIEAESDVPNKVQDLIKKILPGMGRSDNKFIQWFGSNRRKSGYTEEAIAWLKIPEDPVIMTEALRYKAISFLDNLLDENHMDEESGKVDTKLAALKLKAAELLVKQDSIQHNTLNIQNNFKLGRHSLQDLNDQLLQLTKLHTDEIQASLPSNSGASTLDTVKSSLSSEECEMLQAEVVN